MGRRIAAGILLLLNASPDAHCAVPKATEVQKEAAAYACKPGQSCWPTPAEWQRLNSRLNGKLQEAQSFLQPCRIDPGSDACAAVMGDAKNPFAIADYAGGAQSTGWLGAWDAEPSGYAVAAENAQDIMAAVDFAREHRMRLVVKGTGHDYLGRSNAPDSLLVWTHKMRNVTMQDAFVGQGCAASQAAIPAVTVEAGTRWLEAYQEVTVKHRRYVQGGGCTSVGAAGGVLQGGGFGCGAKKYGTAAAGMRGGQVVAGSGRWVV